VHSLVLIKDYNSCVRFRKDFLGEISTYAFTPTQVSTRFCHLTDSGLIFMERVKKKSHSKVVVSDGATLLNLTVKSHCLAQTVFPVCGLRNLKCSWQFFLSWNKVTVQPFLMVLCHPKWANN
jgi:hypothetical protein